MQKNGKGAIRNNKQRSKEATKHSKSLSKSKVTEGERVVKGSRSEPRQGLLHVSKDFCNSPPTFQHLSKTSKILFHGPWENDHSNIAIGGARKRLTNEHNVHFCQKQTSELIVRWCLHHWPTSHSNLETSQLALRTLGTLGTFDRGKHRWSRNWGCCCDLHLLAVPLSRSALPLNTRIWKLLNVSAQFEHIWTNLANLVVS